MGTSRFRSHVRKDTTQTVTIRSMDHVSATAMTVGASGMTITGNASITGDLSVVGDINTTEGVKAMQFVKMGNAEPYTYIFTGAGANEAAVVAEATAMSADTSIDVGASLKGSIYMNTAGGVLWVFDGDDTATSVVTTT